MEDIKNEKIFERPVVMPGHEINNNTGNAVIFPKPYRHRSMEDVPRESGFAGSVALYVLMSIGIFLLNFLTLGLLYPILYVKKREYIIDNTYIDGRKLAFYGEGKEIYGKALMWNYLSFLTLGILAFKKVMVLEQWVTENTEYEDTDNQEDVSDSVFTGKAGEYAKIRILTLVLLPLTIGIYYPFGKLREYKYLIDHTYINGAKLELSAKGGKLFGPHIILLLVGILTAGIGFACSSIANKKYLYKFIRSTDQYFNYDDADKGIDYSDAEVMSGESFDADAYANAVATSNGIEVDKAKPLVDERVAYAKENIAKFRERDNVYKKDRAKFRRIGAAPLCLALILLVLVSAIAGPIYGQYKKYASSVENTLTTSKIYAMDEVFHSGYRGSKEDREKLEDKCKNAVRMYVLNGGTYNEPEAVVPDKVLNKNVISVRLTTGDNTTKITLGKNVLSAAIKGNAITDLELNEGLQELVLEEAASLKSVTLPSSLKVFKIGNGKSLESISLPQGIKRVELSEVSNLAGELTIPNGVSDLRIKDANKITKLNIGDDFQEIYIDGMRSLEKFRVPDNCERSYFGDVYCKELTLSESTKVVFSRFPNIRKVITTNQDYDNREDGLYANEDAYSPMIEYLNDDWYGDNIEGDKEVIDRALSKILAGQNYYVRYNGTDIVRTANEVMSRMDDVYIKVENGKVVRAKDSMLNVNTNKKPLTIEEEKILLAKYDELSNRLSNMLEGYKFKQYNGDYCMYNSETQTTLKMDIGYNYITIKDTGDYYTPGIFSVGKCVITEEDIRRL